MNEIEIIRRAYEYIEKMSRGINPLSDNPIPDGDLVKQKQISGCLSYVSNILSEIIVEKSNKQERVKTQKRKLFEISDEEISLLVPLNHSAYLREIVNVINTLAAKDGHYKFQAKWINSYLLHIGFLTKKGEFKVATRQGEEVGIISQLRVNDKTEEYYANTYTPAAQQFIFDNINSILEYVNENCNDGCSENKVQKVNNRFINLVYPIEQTVSQFCSERRNTCIIASTGSCILQSEYGSYSAIMMYNDRVKFISKSGIKTRSANYCILEGMLDAAMNIKSKTDVLLLSSCALGFSTKNSPNKGIINDIFRVLTEKGCTVYYSCCGGRAAELNNLIYSNKS